MNVWITLEVNTAEYKTLVEHITNNMFFGVKRLAPNLRHMVFHSIGDAMYDDLQDLENAEVYLQQQISDDSMDPGLIKQVIDDKKWYISAVDPKSKKILMFIVEKDTDFILFRQEKTKSE